MSGPTPKAKHAQPVAAPARAPLPAWLSPLAQFAFIGLAAVAVYGFVGTAKDGELRRRCTPLCGLNPQYAGAARKVPNFTLNDLDGKPVSMSQFEGKVVVLNIWATTCLPCREEIPDLAEMTQVLAKRSDVAVLTISTDEDAATVQQFLGAVLGGPAPFPVLMDPDRQVSSGRFGTNLVPETWIVDKRGVVRARFDGQRPWTSGLVTQLVDQIRDGGYCPLEIQGDRVGGEGALVCRSL